MGNLKYGLFSIMQDRVAKLMKRNGGLCCSLIYSSAICQQVEIIMEAVVGGDSF